MEIIDIVAILGALAWTPHLISIIKKWLTTSKIRVITQKHIEIGFTTFGPIVNIRLAFAVENKDSVVTDLKMKIIHESGEKKEFECQGITQQIGKMTMPDSGVMQQEKEHSVLAIKLNQSDIEERFMRFQEVTYIKIKKEYEDKALKRIAYLRSENKYDVTTFLREPEMTELYSFNKQAFLWKQGKYSIIIEMQSPTAFKIFDNKAEFNLTSQDVERLEKNKDYLEQDYKLMLAAKDDDDIDFNWQWRYPGLTKI